MRKAPALAALAVATVSACNPVTVTVAPEVPARYEVLGPTRGRACGFMGIGPYGFLPIGLDGRVAAAYDDALRGAPGATGLINVTFREDVKWYFLFTERCTIVEGEAIR